MGTCIIDYNYPQHYCRVEVKKIKAVGSVHSMKGSMNRNMDLLVSLLKGICINEASSFDHTLFYNMPSPLFYISSLSLRCYIFLVDLIWEVNTELAMNRIR